MTVIAWLTFGFLTLVAIVAAVVWLLEHLIRAGAEFGQP